jgi:hypothetical protein
MEDAMLRLLGRQASGNVQKVIFILEELGLPYVREDYGRQFGNTQTDAYRKLNPNAKVPTLLDGELAIWESHTILRYLAAIHGPQLTGANPADRTLVERNTAKKGPLSAARSQSIQREASKPAAERHPDFTAQAAVSTQDLVPDEQLPMMGDVALGIVTSGIYSAAADRPANKAFLAAWDREYGGKAIPNFLSADGWDGMSAIFDLIKVTKGKFTGDEAIKFLSNWKTADSPRGPISIDPATRDIILNVYMRRTEMKDGKLANIEFETIPNVKDPWKEFNPPK